MSKVLDNILKSSRGRFEQKIIDSRSVFESAFDTGPKVFCMREGCDIVTSCALFFTLWCLCFCLHCRWPFVFAMSSDLTLHKCPKTHRKIHGHIHSIMWALSEQCCDHLLEFKQTTSFLVDTFFLCHWSHKSAVCIVDYNQYFEVFSPLIL